MAECNYDEVTHSVYPPENPDPMYHWDAHFPERLSRLHLNNVDFCPSCPAAFLLLRRSSNGARRPRDRCAGRYKTQPITFDEIAEVDDDDVDAAAVTSSSSVTSQDVERCQEARAASFRGQAGSGFFSRSVDGLVVGPAASSAGYRPQAVPTTGSDKENTPCCCADDDDDRKLGQDQLPALSAVGPVFPLLFDGSGSGGDVTRHRRKRSGRRLRNRNSVPEEAPDTEKMVDESNAAAAAE